MHVLLERILLVSSALRISSFSWQNTPRSSYLKAYMYTFFMAANTSSDESYAVLRQQIIEGKLRPGTRLQQNEIAEQLGLSRVPLREAIRKLEGERLVAVVPRKG